MQLLGKGSRSTLPLRKKQGQFVFSRLLHSNFHFVSEDASNLPPSFLLNGGEGKLDFFKLSKGSLACILKNDFKSCSRTFGMTCFNKHRHG